MTSDVMEGYLLSPQQLRLWHAQRGLDTNPFMTTLRLRIEGPLDSARLARAITHVVNRHDVLRTTYASVGGAPLQVVQPAIAELDLQADDSSVDLSDEMPRVDLQTGPMLRAALRRVAPDRHLIFIAMPAIAGDMTSAQIVASEVARAYAAEVGGLDRGNGDGDGGEEVAQYLQYSEYQHEWLKGDEARDLQDRWAALSSEAPPLDLATARSTLPPTTDAATASATARRFAIERHAVPLEAASISALREACARLGVDLGSGLAAVWHILVARFTGQTRFRLSHELDGRTFDELAALPGAFARVVPVDVELDPSHSFAAIATAVQQRLDDLRACQDGFIPPDAHVRTGADLEAQAATQFAFVALRDTFDAGECRVVLDAAWSCHTRFRVRLHAVSIGTGVDLAVECDGDRADEALARQLAASYAVLAAAFAADPYRAIGSAPLLSAEQRHRIVVEWNQTAADPLDRRFAHERFEAQVERQPEAIAVRTGTADVSFADLNARAARVAAWLRARGAQPESIVAVVATPSLAAVAGILGVLKSGAAYLPIDPSLPAERIAFMLRDADVLAVLTEGDLPGASEWAAHARNRFVLTAEEAHDRDATAAPAPRVPLRPDHAAYVIYTSGSTGTPKGVIVTHGGLANYLDWCQSAYVDDVGTGAPLHSSLSFDLTVTSLFGPLVAGQAITLAPADARVEGLTHVLRERADFAWVKVTPGHARLLAERLGAPALRGRTRRLIVGGEALTEADLRAWRAGAPDTIILNEYGPTEAVVGCAVYQLTTDVEEPVPIGRPIRNARLYVLDANSIPCRPGSSASCSSAATGWLADTCGVRS